MTESNAGWLGEKHKCCLCAMPPHQNFSLKSGSIIKVENSKEYPPPWWLRWLKFASRFDLSNICLAEINWDSSISFDGNDNFKSQWPFRLTVRGARLSTRDKLANSLLLVNQLLKALYSNMGYICCLYLLYTMNNATHSYTKYNTNSSSRWDHKFTLTELIFLLAPR